LLDMHPFRRIPILRPRAFLDLKPWVGFKIRYNERWEGL